MTYNTGFRPARSTIDVITEFTTYVLPCFDKRVTCISVYTDLSKAFDTINHNIRVEQVRIIRNTGQGLGVIQKLLS